MALLDPRITYTGASLATLVNAAGLIAYKPHNLLTWSAVSTTNWSLAANVTVTAGSVADPDGAMTGATIAWGSASAGNGVLKVVSGVNGAANSKAIYVRADVAGGTVELVDPGSIVGSTVATLTTSWQRVSLSEVAGAQAASGGVWLRKTASSPATIYVCWATFNFGPLQPYYPTTGSAYFGPRFTYDPVTHAALGLLIEEQRTNVLTHSEQFDNAAWPLSGSTVSANAVASPDGSTTADKLIENVGAGAHLLNRAGATVGSASVMSVYAKAAERTQIALQLGADVGYYNLSNGTVVSGANASIVSIGGGWYRCILTCTPVNTNSLIYIASSGSASYTGDGASGIYLWGAQLEAGSFATSYIPTTSASVTRAADSATITGSNFSSWFNAAQGTFVAEFFQASNTAPRAVLSGDTDSYRIMYGNNADTALYAYDGTRALSYGFVPITRSKLAFAYTGSTMAGCANGGTVVGSVASGNYSAMTKLFIGISAFSSSWLNAPISRLRYYNTALTNAQLQALTK